MALSVKDLSEILSSMLGNISDNYQKSPGFLTYDFVKTTAMETEQLYQYLQSIANLRLVKDLSGDDLTVRVYDNKGLIRKVATKAKVSLTITGVGTINTGDLFSTPNNIQFTSLETKTITNTGTILAECTEAGSKGMVGANSVTQFPITIQGITAVNNPAASYDGFEEETDEDLKSRYYELLRDPITSANMAHYKFWAKSITGVGNAKVIPLWNGANTVKVIILDANMTPASTQLIDAVQLYIDPKGTNNATWGTGAGQAPIGAYCTVVSATSKSINISATINKASGFTDQNIIDGITNKVKSYFKDIAFSSTINYVSYTKIVSLILEVDGVLDAQNVTINNGTVNVTVGNEEVATVGTVTLT